MFDLILEILEKADRSMGAYEPLYRKRLFWLV